MKLSEHGKAARDAAFRRSVAGTSAERFRRLQTVEDIKSRILAVEPQI